MEGPAMWRGIRLYMNSFGGHVSNQVSLIPSTVQSEFETEQKEYTKSNIEEYCNRIIQEVTLKNECLDIINRQKITHNWSSFGKIGVATVIPLSSTNYNATTSLNPSTIQKESEGTKTPDICTNPQDESQIQVYFISHNSLQRKKSLSKLFSECYNEHTLPTEGLVRAHMLRNHVLMRKKKSNTKVYNSMLKAFVMCKDITTACQVMDEMIQDKIEVNITTMNILLQCCQSHEGEKCNSVLQIWKKMRELRIMPNIQSYNLLLKCLSSLSNNHDQISQEAALATYNVRCSNNTEIVNSNLSLFLQAEHTFLTSSEIQNSATLLTGFLNLLDSDNIKPDITLFKFLLVDVCHDYSTEEHLIKAMSRYNVKVDQSFCTKLADQRCVRGECDNAQEVLSLMKSHGIEPNAEIMKILAMSCSSLHQATLLLPAVNNLCDLDYKEVMEILVQKSLSIKDFYYTYEVLREMKKKNVAVSQHIYKLLRETHVFLKTNTTKTSSSSKIEASDGEKLFVLEFNNLTSDKNKMKDHPLMNK